MPAPASLLLVTHVFVRQGPRGVQIDDQTAAGIVQWRRHFDSITFYGVTPPDGWGDQSHFVDAHDGALGPDVRVIALPRAYAPPAMVRHLPAVRRELSAAIGRHRHLCFTLGSILGDWPAVAAWEALRQRRRYAAWIDRVEPAIIRNRAAGSVVRRALAEATIPAMQGGVRYLLRRSHIALLQGGDTYAYYAGSCRNPHCTYDIHTHADERIDAATLAAKQARVRSGTPPKIVYAGRATAMKGPFEWIAVLERLRAQAVPFEATWIGDGPDLPAMRAAVATAGLEGQVALPGFEGDRDRVLHALSEGDMMLFCHKTPESARCLIESLVRGCPLAGYGSAYPQGLLAGHGGGVLVAQGDVAGLAGAVAGLHADRGALSDMIGAAALSGERFTEDAVYAHRAALMRQA